MYIMKILECKFSCANSLHFISHDEKLDHIPSSYKVLVVHNVVKVVNIVCAWSISHIDAGTSIVEMVRVHILL